MQQNDTKGFGSHYSSYAGHPLVETPHLDRIAHKDMKRNDLGPYVECRYIRSTLA